MNTTETKKAAKYLNETKAVSTDSGKGCTVFAKDGTQILQMKFRRVPKRAEIRAAVVNMMAENPLIPAYLTEAIIKQVEATVVFNLQI